MEGIDFMKELLTVINTPVAKGQTFGFVKVYEGETAMVTTLKGVREGIIKSYNRKGLWITVDGEPVYSGDIVRVDKALN